MLWRARPEILATRPQHAGSSRTNPLDLQAAGPDRGPAAGPGPGPFPAVRIELGGRDPRRHSGRGDDPCQAAKVALAMPRQPCPPLPNG